MMQKIHIIFPKDMEYNGIKPKIPVEIDGKKIVATIVRSTITAEGAHFVVDIPKEIDAEKFMKVFTPPGTISYKRSLVNLNKDECIECGQCTALCSYDALTLDEEFNIVVNKDNCVGCRMCVDACPRKCITIF